MAKNEHKALAGIILIFFMLALVYNWASPLFENSDELFHFPLIKYMADNDLSLPVQDPANIQEWHQEGSQPPLYHMAAALLIKPIDLSDYTETRRLNPHARIGIVSDSNINAVIHPLDRSEEFSGGTAIALRLVRLFSTVLAAVVVAATYFLTVYTFPDVPRWVGLLAAALVAFNPMYLFVASSINNDNMANAAISTVLVLLVWMYRRDSLPPVRVMLLIGVLLGIGMLSKLSTGPFMLLVGLFWLALALKHRAFPYMVKWGVVTLGIALLISGWWYLRNYDLYGDLTGLNVFVDIAGRRPTALTAEQLWSERESFIRSFWGLYGGLTVDMAAWTYTVFNVLAVISITGAVVFFSRGLKLFTESGKTKPFSLHTGLFFDLPRIALFLWPLMAFISLIRWTSMTWASQGRLWFVSLSALATLGAVGFYELSRRTRQEIAAVPAIFALVTAAAAPFVWIRPAYAPPKLIPAVEFSEDETLAEYTDPEFPDESVRLVSVTVPDEIRTGQEIHVELAFCANTPLSRNWSIFVHLVNPFQIILTQADFTPGGGALPTSEMAAGLCWTDRYPIEVKAGIAPEDTILDVLVGLYDARDNTRMVLADGTDHYFVQQTQLKVGDALQQFTFGDVVRLKSYEISSVVIGSKDEVTVTLEWEVLKPLNKDYTVFVQILDPRTTSRIAASDQQPAGGTSNWQPGQSITDIHSMTVAENPPPGGYVVLIGFYELTEGGAFNRLRLVYDGVDTGYDSMTLTQVRVE
ncbi:MAG: hypothetical protein KJ064_09680 [Anaerolineae bacterium]|nr:hypothetical protein [Anaerolineae bacterium]